MRSDAAWARFLKTFDVSRTFSVDPRSKGVELPVSIKAGGRENLLLLIRSGELKKTSSGALATVTLQQTTARGQVVGGSTFIFKKAAKLG